MNNKTIPALLLSGLLASFSSALMAAGDGSTGPTSPTPPSMPSTNGNEPGDANGTYSPGTPTPNPNDSDRGMGEDRGTYDNRDRPNGGVMTPRPNNGPSALPGGSGGAGSNP